MFVGDMFVPYVRYEVRFWFIALLLVLLRFARHPSPDMPALQTDLRNDQATTRVASP
jgi:hypothetical protein